MAGSIAAAVALLPGLAALASGPSDTSQRDATAYVTDGPVHAVAHVPGGNTYIGGDFGHVGPRSGHGLALGAAGPDGTGGAHDPAFPALDADNFPEVAGGEVRAVVSDQNGGWFIGGDFRSVGGADIPRLAHVTPTGVDTSWAPEPNNTVLTLALDHTTSATEWTLYAGGKFTQIETAGAKSNLAAWRIGPDGVPASPGESDEPGVPFPSTEPLPWAPGQQAGQGGGDVYSVAVTTLNVDLDPASLPETPEPAAVVFVGGDFIKIGKNQQSLNRLAAIWGAGTTKPDGTSVSGNTVGDAGWNPGPNTLGNSVRSIALGPVADTATSFYVPVYFGGIFGSPVGLRASRFQLLKSNISASAGAFSWTPNVDGTVRTLALSEGTPPDGATLYLGGDFGNAGGQGRNSLAAVAAIPEGSANTATPCNPTPCPATLRNNWNPAPPDGNVTALAASGGTVYAGGSFTSIGAGTPATRNGLAALVGSGATGPAGEPEGSGLGWDARPAGGATNALALQDDSLYAGGGFYSVGASQRKNLAALDPAGVLMDDFDTATSCEGAGCRDDVRALELAPDAKQLYVGGAFTQVGGEPRAHLAALSLEPPASQPPPPDPPDTSIGAVIGNWEPNPDNWVLTLDVAGGTLYAGGAFDNIGEAPDPQAARGKLAALDRQTGAVRDWDPNARCVAPLPYCEPTFDIYAVEASCDSVYVGGGFDRIGAVPAEGTQPERSRIAELDPNTAAATAWNPDANSVVRTLAVDGDLVYAGGDFAQIGDASVANGRAERHYIAALRRSDGSATGWNPAADYKVRALAVGGDGETVYAGGSFNQIGGAARSRLAALSAGGTGNATAWNPSAFNVDPNDVSAVRALSVAATEDPDGDGPLGPGDGVYLGGEFTDLGTSSQRGYAQFRSYDPVTGREVASGEPLSCASDPQQDPNPVPADTSAPDLGQPSVTDGGQTLVLALSEPADVHVDLTGSAPGLMPMGTGAVCAPDTAELRAQLQRALRSKVRTLPSRKRAKKLRRLIAKRACTVALPPNALDADATQGENRISLGEGHALTAGSYRATITATDTAGNVTQPRSIDFQVGP